MKKEIRFKSPKAKLVYDLLAGRKVSIKTGFTRYSITNIPREISRMIEQGFNVTIDKKRIENPKDYNPSGYYFEYCLIKKDQPPESIESMYAFIKENMEVPESKSDNPSGYSQWSLF